MSNVAKTKILLADNLRSLRETHGYTQAQVAEMVGIDRTTVTRCESRTHVQFPAPDVVDRFAHFYQVKIGDLFRVHGAAEKNFSIVATVDTAMQIINKHMAEGAFELIKMRKK
jgi:transcriptional regulator with XRE-family HTH domain